MVECEAAAEQTVAGPTKKRGSFAGDVFKLVGGTTIAQGLTLLVAPILSRLYAPAAFGTAALFISIVGVIAAVACLRYEFAIMLPEHGRDAANVLAVSIGAALVTSGISATLITLARGPIVQLLNAPELTPYLWLIPWAVLLQGIFQALNYWNSRTKHFGRLSIARVAAALTTGGAQLGIGVVGDAHEGGLIGASVAGSAVVTTALGGQIWRDDRRLFQNSIRLRHMLDSLKRYRKFPLIDSWGGLLNTISWQLPVLLLSVYFSQARVGFYSMAYRLIQLPMTLVGSAIAQVFFQRASEVQSQRGDLTGTVEMVFQRLVALALYPALAMTIAGQEIFVVVFGPAWAEAGIYVQILGLWMFFWFISSPLSTLFSVLEHQELGLIVHVAIFVTRAISLVVGGALDSVYLALGLFAGSGILVYGGLSIWNIKLAGVPLRRSLHILVQQGLYCAPAITILVFLKALCNAPAWLVLAVIVAGFAINLLLILRQDPALERYVTLFVCKIRRLG
jgi:lipopolysaccharide exporter